MGYKGCPRSPCTFFKLSKNRQYVPSNIATYTGRQEDVSSLRCQGFTVDDDNDPAPENIPEDYLEYDDADIATLDVASLKSS